MKKTEFHVLKGFVHMKSDDGLIDISTKADNVQVMKFRVDEEGELHIDKVFDFYIFQN